MAWPRASASEEEVEALRRENARLRRSVEELSVLNELAAAIGGGHDAEAVMQTVLQRSLRAVGAEQGAVTLVDEAAGQEEGPARTMIREAVTSAGREALHLEAHLLAWMTRHRQPLVVNAPREDPRFRGIAWRPDVRSLLSVPLMVRDRFTGALTVFNKQAPGGFADEDERLLSILGSQSAQVIENARLVEEERALIGMREQLRVAATIQAALLPAAPPVVPGYEVAGRSLPSEAVGGDYFDFLSLGEERVGLCVGDVVGKGLPAALLMANVQATLRGQARWIGAPGEGLARANALLHASTDRRAFVTLFYGVLDTRHHVLRYANAGHNRPLWLAGEAPAAELEGGGLALGLVPAATYAEGEVRFAVGDLLLVFSDGVTEAMSPEREPFGEERLAAVIEGARGASAEAVVARVVEAVRRHADGASQSDDVTLVAVRRTA